MKKNNRLLPDWKDSGGLQQVSRMMKCVLFFMLTLVCGVEGKVYSQQYTLDLHLKQTSLEEVFNRIEAQTGLKFLYNTLLIDSKGKVDVEARQEDIRKVLAELLNPLGLTYILNSNHIVVKQADAAAPQEKTVIKGKVTDSKGSPLPGVTVRIKGTNIGVVSDNDGHYELTLPAGTDPTLIFSFVGMLSQEAKYTGQRELNIILHENIGGLFHGFLCALFLATPVTSIRKVHVAGVLQTHCLTAEIYDGCRIAISGRGQNAGRVRRVYQPGVRGKREI